jgi:hypothetical protein
MSVVDVSRNAISGGYFLLNQHRGTPFASPPGAAGSEQVLVTYRDSGAPIRSALIAMIRGATRRVFVASFMLGDEEVIREMIAAAERLKGGVYLITALDERSLGRGLREYEDNEQESPEERKKNFERLTSAGVYVRGHESCHAKFAVVDDCAAIVGSANFVSKGFEWTGEANVYLRDVAPVRQLIQLFGELWYEGCAWEIPPGITYLVAKRSASAPPHRPTSPDGRPGEIVWTNGGGQMSLVGAIQEIIQSAQKDLILATYSIVQMQAKPHLLHDHILRAVERGVRVRLFVRQRNAWPDQMGELVVLHDAGVSIHADLRNHAKVAIADSVRAMLFSANFDGIHGLDSGVEVGYRLKESSAIGELVRFMEHAITNADTSFRRNPTAAELDGRLAARWCKSWPRESELAVACQPEEFGVLAKQAAAGPCLYEELNDKQYRLYVGGAVVDGVFERDTCVSSVGPTPDGCDAAARLKEWMKSPRIRGDSVPVARGFFAGRFRHARRDDKAASLR